MSRHLSAQQVEQYRERLMSPAELLYAGDHLAACESCRERIAGAGQAGAAVAGLREALNLQARAPQEHLTYEQIEAYVDDRLDEVDREIVDSHGFVCTQCKEEMRDLFAFKDTLSSSAPAAVAAVPASPATLREKVLVWWRRPQWKFAGAMAALALVALIVWLTLRARDGARQEIVEVRPTQTPTASPQPTASTQPTVSVSPTPTPLPTATPVEVNAQGSPTPRVRPTQQPTPVRPRVLAPQGEPVLALNDNGERITLDSAGNLVGLGAMPPSERQAVRTALLNERLTPSASLAEVRVKGGTLMGSGDEEPTFALVGPKGTIVQGARPTFRWRALAGATSYSVKVYDRDFNPVASSGPLTGTEWEPAAGALAPGKVYTWQVTATKEGADVVAPAPPAPEARFKVLEGSKAEGLERSLSAAGNSHLARGVLYARAGLLDEAERELDTLLESNPGSRAAARLLASVRAMR